MHRFHAYMSAAYIQRSIPPHLDAPSDLQTSRPPYVHASTSLRLQRALCTSRAPEFYLRDAPPVARFQTSTSLYLQRSSSRPLELHISMFLCLRTCCEPPALYLNVAPLTAR